MSTCVGKKVIHILFICPKTIYFYIRQKNYIYNLIFQRVTYSSSVHQQPLLYYILFILLPYRFIVNHLHVNQVYLLCLLDSRKWTLDFAIAWRLRLWKSNYALKLHTLLFQKSPCYNRFQNGSEIHSCNVVYYRLFNFSDCVIFYQSCIHVRYSLNYVLCKLVSFCPFIR